MVLLTDAIDVDLFPPSMLLPHDASTSSLQRHYRMNVQPSVQREALAWTSRVRAFVETPHLELTASGDSHAPINGGVLLLKPRATTYARGLDILRRGRFNTTHGFDLAGPPQSLLLASMSSALSSDHRQRVRVRRALRRFWGTRMVRDDTWDFVAANADQGLFSYIYLTKLHGAAFRQSRHYRRCTGSRLWHFWGGSKPWARRDATSCLPWFDFLTVAGEPAGQSTCLDWLRTRRDGYVAAGANATECGGYNLHCVL